MSFQTTYKRLFSVEILHDYFLNQGSTAFDDLDPADRTKIKKKYNLQNVIQIYPTSRSARTLRDQNLLFRTNNTGFFVGARLDEVAFRAGVQKPLMPVEAPFRLSFAMHLINPYLLNFTSLPLLTTGYSPYYFSNRSANGFHLSKPVEAHSVDLGYQAGSIHVDDEIAPTQLFEAVRDTGPGPRVPADWVVAAPVLQYATQSDLRPIYGSIFSLDLSSTSLASARVEIYEPGIATPILVQETSGQPLISVFSVDLRSLGTGSYDLVVKDAAGTVVPTGRSGAFYLDDELFAAHAFGLIEIEHDPSVSDDALHLVEPADQTLRSPVFTLRFRNRRTFWRYIFNTDQAPPDLGDFEPDPLPGDDPAAERRRFKTKGIKPLTEAVEELTKFDSAELLPNPDIGLVKPNKADKKIYSETFLQN